MSSIDLGSATAGLLDREVTVAKSGFNRWLVPPAALAIHLCIGMAYGFSVFWVPLGKVISLATGAAKPVAVLWPIHSPHATIHESLAPSVGARAQHHCDKH